MKSKLGGAALDKSLGLHLKVYSYLIYGDNDFKKRLKETKT